MLFTRAFQPALLIPIVIVVRFANAAAPAKPTSRPSPEIRLEKIAEWQASTRDVQKVLDSAAAQLCRHFPERDFAPILVEPKGGPITLYARGPAGEYRVRLNTGGLFWSQYAYQFAHEMCHILCNCRPGDSANKWFEESLCELASIYTLRAMGKAWRTDPPYPNWRDYAPKLDSYAQNLITAGRLPRNTSLAEFIKENLESLRKDSNQRDKNRIVAVALLPLFEKEPERWEAVQYLNAADTSPPRSFELYVSDWRAQAPAKHKPFVTALAREMGVELRN